MFCPSVVGEAELGTASYTLGDGVVVKTKQVKRITVRKLKKKKY